MELITPLLIQYRDLEFPIQGSFVSLSVLYYNKALLTILDLSLQNKQLRSLGRFITYMLLFN